MKFEDKKLGEKNIFFTDKTRIDTQPNTSGESIRISVKIRK